MPHKIRGLPFDLFIYKNVSNKTTRYTDYSYIYICMAVHSVMVTVLRNEQYSNPERGC